MKKMFRRMSLLLAVLLIMTSLVGCNNKENSSTPDTGNTTPDTTPVTTASTKDTLVYAVEDDLVNMNPNAKMYQIEMWLCPMLSDTLAFDTGEGFKPLLAESWKIADDGLSYTIKLREDVKFHNGDEFTAEDMVFTFENGREYPNQVDDMATMDSFEAVDKYTFKVNMKSVDAAAERIILTAFNALPKKYYEEVGELGYSQKPIGTGPFKFVEREVGSHIKVERYDEYWGDKPALREVTFNIINDLTTATAALEAGQIDMMRLTNASTLAVIKENEKLKITNAPSANINYTLVNPAAPPFDNIKVRQAFAYCLDRQSMVDVLAGGYGNAHSVLCPKGLFGYSDAVEPKYDYDIEKAKALLAEAGIKTPMDIGKIVTFPSSAPAAQMVQYNLSQIGLNAEIQQYDLSVAMQTMDAGDFAIGMWDCGTGAELWDIDWVLSSEGLCNYGQMYNDRVDELLLKARGDVNADNRLKYYEEILSEVQKECKYMMLYDNDVLYANDAKLITPIYKNGKIRMAEFAWTE